MSRGPRFVVLSTTSGGSGCSRSAKPSGGRTSTTRDPALMPSFRGSGVRGVAGDRRNGARGAARRHGERARDGGHDVLRRGLHGLEGQRLEARGRRPGRWRRARSGCAGSPRAGAARGRCPEPRAGARSRSITTARGGSRPSRFRSSGRPPPSDRPRSRLPRDGGIHVPTASGDAPMIRIVPRATPSITACSPSRPTALRSGSHSRPGARDPVVPFRAGTPGPARAPVRRPGRAGARTGGRTGSLVRRHDEPPLAIPSTPCCARPRSP